MFIVKSILFLMLLTSFAFAKEPVTVYLAGDSTCAIKQPDKRPETGWGEMLPAHFKEGKVKIDNRAMNGRSTKTFISEGRWQAIIDALKPGDYVFIQFAHNDEAKEKTERYTPPDEYRKNLIKFIEEVRAKKAIPVLLTPVMRRRFDENGEFVDSHVPAYPEAVRALAKEYKVAVIDMQRSSEAVLKKYGPEESKKLFLHVKAGENANYPKGIEDNTHFSPMGAEEMAKLVVAGIREQKLGLKKYLKN